MYVAVKVGSCRALLRVMRVESHACRALPPKAPKADTPNTRPARHEGEPDTNRHGPHVTPIQPDKKRHKPRRNILELKTSRKILMNL